MKAMTQEWATFVSLPWGPNLRTDDKQGHKNWPFLCLNLGAQTQGQTASKDIKTGHVFVVTLGPKPKDRRQARTQEWATFVSLPWGPKLRTDDKQRHKNGFIHYGKVGPKKRSHSLRKVGPQNRFYSLQCSNCFKTSFLKCVNSN